MRRTTILAVRAILVALLAAAVADIPLPSRSRPRLRMHLVDRSDSVRRGPPDAPRPEDADRIRQFDQDHESPGDRTLWASFGREIAFESTAVDGTGTNLAGALEAALARSPTEIVLYTDGRADPGRSLLLCRARGVPVHVFPLGASHLRDARIARVKAPPGERVAIEVTVLSTFDAAIPVRLGDQVREAKVLANVPTIVSFPDRPPGPFTVKLEIDDDCPENNEARGAVVGPAGAKKVLLLSNDSPVPAGFDVRRSPRFLDPHGFDLVVVDNIALSAQDERSLATWVRDFGGGLVLLGGPKSYALGGWKGGPLDEISPLRATPDERVAVVFVIDASGSMHQPGKLDAIVDALRAAWRFFSEKDDVVQAYAFPEGRWIATPRELSRLEASGGTNIAQALEKARQRLVQTGVERRQIFLFTDGEAPPEETPEMRKRAADRIKEDQIALSTFTEKPLPELGNNRTLGDWKELLSKLNEVLPATREVQKANPGMLVLHEHPATAGLANRILSWMNLTSAKSDAQIVGTVGKPPRLYPAIAFRQAGRGRVGAFAFEKPDPKLLAQSLDYVAGERTGGIVLTVDPPVLRARGAGPGRLEATYQALPSGESGTLELRQVLSDTWEAPLPATKPGTLWVRSGGAQATQTIPCAPEYEALGIDWTMLARIATETGGRVLRSPEELAQLPRPQGSISRPGRPVWLVAALAVFFLEMALSTFWKA